MAPAGAQTRRQQHTTLARHVEGETSDGPDLEARAILDEAEKLLTLGRLEEASEQASTQSGMHTWKAQI